MLKLENIKVSYKLAAIVIVGIVGFLSLLFISANALKENLVAEREARLKAVIQSTLSQVAYLNQTLPKEQAQEQAKALINALRFDGNNYMFVIDESRYTVVHPIRQDLVGQQMGNPGKDTEGQFWFTMIDLARNGQQGSLIYPWKNQQGNPADKLSFVNGFAPWGWILGSGMLLDDIEHAVYQQFLRMGFATLIVTLVMIGRELTRR